MKILDRNNITGIAALLIHAAKIDEKYSEKEKSLIKDFIKSYLKDNDNESVLIKAEEIEKNSNQLLNFTNIIKKNTEEVKSDIIEHLWKIIISDNSIDLYESNLMRRICGLIYFPDKLSAEIKMKLLNNK
ncbi:MAG: TerB family tellurite resistance protein [Candidatus Pelagibacter sp.]|tara:strand:+ start:322 stop:711 length:390 start_codon:yes stop_codon:yes gene_type:complete